MLELDEYKNVIANMPLPENITWCRNYKKEVLFPVMSVSGGVRHNFICYLVHHDHATGYSRWAIELNPFKMTAVDFAKRIAEGIEQFQGKLRNGTATKIDLDGGDLGREINN